MRLFVYVTSIIMSFSAAITHANELEKCISGINMRGHRLDRHAAIIQCFEDTSASVSKDTCYNSIQKHKSIISSSQLYTKATSSCFYEAGAFKNISECVNDTKRFALAKDHDDAIYYCERQFRDKLSQNDCSAAAKKMIFPTNRDRLLNHCTEL